MDAERTEEINKLRQDCTDMHQQNNQISFLLNKYKQEVNEKDALIGRSNSDNDAEVMNLRQQLESKKSENSQLAATIREVRSNMKDSENDWERRKRELLDRNSSLEMEARKYKEEYLRICDVLKNKINSAIDHVSYKK